MEQKSNKIRVALQVIVLGAFVLFIFGFIRFVNVTTAPEIPILTMAEYVIMEIEFVNLENNDNMCKYLIGQKNKDGQYEKKVYTTHLCKMYCVGDRLLLKKQVQ
jgi:hypothetical protein